MEAKPFLKGLSWLLLANLLIKPAWIFFIDRRVQNIVGHESYGTYFALFNLTYMLLFIGDAGITGMLTQRLAATESVNVRQLVRVKISLLGAYAAVCAGVAYFSGVTAWTFLAYLIGIQSLTSFFVFLRGLLTARQLFRTDAFFSVLEKSLLFLFCVGPVYGYFFPVTILLFLQLQTASLCIAVSSLGLVLIRKKGFSAGEKVRMKIIGKWVLPFVLIIVGMSVHNRLDAFLLDRLHPNGAIQAGIYAMAYRLLDAGNMIGYLLASFLLPFLARHRTKTLLVQTTVLFSRHVLLFLAAGVVAFVAVFSSWLQKEMYHSANAYTNKVILYTLIALPAYYLIHVYSTILTAFASFRLLLLVIFSAAIGNLLLNIWLIPFYGALGSAYAALVSQYGCGMALWFLTSRKHHLPLSVRTAFLYLAATFFFIITLYVGKQLTHHVWLILCSIAAIVSVGLWVSRNRLQQSFLPFFK